MSQKLNELLLKIHSDAMSIVAKNKASGDFDFSETEFLFFLMKDVPALIQIKDGGNVDPSLAALFEFCMQVSRSGGWDTLGVNNELPVDYTDLATCVVDKCPEQTQYLNIKKALILLAKGSKFMDKKDQTGFFQMISDSLESYDLMGEESSLLILNN
jgi:hypothetical protein